MLEIFTISTAVTVSWVIFFIAILFAINYAREDSSSFVWISATFMWVAGAYLLKSVPVLSIFSPGIMVAGAFGIGIVIAVLQMIRHTIHCQRLFLHVKESAKTTFIERTHELIEQSIKQAKKSREGSGTFLENVASNIAILFHSEVNRNLVDVFTGFTTASSVEPDAVRQVFKSQIMALMQKFDDNVTADQLTSEFIKTDMWKSILKQRTSSEAGNTRGRNFHAATPFIVLTAPRAKEIPTEVNGIRLFDSIYGLTFRGKRLANYTLAWILFWPFYLIEFMLGSVLSSITEFISETFAQVAGYVMKFTLLNKMNQD